MKKNKKTFARILCLFFVFSAFGGGLMASDVEWGTSYADRNRDVSMVEHLDEVTDLEGTGDSNVDSVENEDEDIDAAEDETLDEVQEDATLDEDSSESTSKTVMRAMADEKVTGELGGLKVTADDGSDLTADDIAISGNLITIKSGKAMTVTGTSTTATIAIAAGVKANLTLNNVSITNAAVSPLNVIENPTGETTTLHLTLADGSDNTLNSSSASSNVAALHVTYGAALTIDDSIHNPVDVYGGRLTEACSINGKTYKAGEPSWVMDSKTPGSLTVLSGLNGAGIGGNYGENCGRLLINGGNIVANAYGTGGNSAGAGIGGGYGGGCGCMLDGGGITINGGNINATAGYHGAGIGTGWNCYTAGTGHEGHVTGDITVNGGYIETKGMGHGNALGGACNAQNKPNIGHGTASAAHQIIITGGTLIPNRNSSEDWTYQLGAAGGDIIVLGGSFPLNTRGTSSGYDITGAKIQSSDGSALTMVAIDLSNYTYKDKDGVDKSLQPGDYLYSYNVTVDGRPVSPEYGLAMKLDDTKKLYFWLPKNAVGRPVAISGVKLQTADGDLVDTEYPFTLEQIPGPGTEGVTKRYVTFEVDKEQFGKELKNQLHKKYDGKTFDWNLLYSEIAKQGIEVPQPQGGEIKKVDEMKASAVRLTGADGKETGEASSDAGIKNAGGYSITVNYMEYAKDPDFSKTFWGHQTTLDASIIPADTRIIEATYKPTIEPREVEGKQKLKLVKMEFHAKLLPDDDEAKTCEPPDGYIQFYINGVKVGDSINLTTAAASDITQDGYSGKEVTKTVSFETTNPPVPDIGGFVVEARYYGGTNYTNSKAEAKEEKDKDVEFVPDRDFPYINPPMPIVKPSGTTEEPDSPGNPPVITGNPLPLDKTDRIDPPGGNPADENDYRLHGYFKDKVREKVDKKKPDANINYFVDLVNKRYVFVDRTGNPLKEDGTDELLKAKPENIKVYDKDNKEIDLEKNPISFAEPGKYRIEVVVTDTIGNITTIDIDYSITKTQLLDPNLNKDTNDDGIPDINIDTDDDGIPDINIDTDGDDKPDINIDTDGDGKPDVDIDTDGDGKPDINKDTDGDGKPDLDIDTNGDGKPDVNVDTNGDGKPDINKDTDGDGKPDVDIDTDGDGKPDINKDTDGDGKPDLDIDTNGDGKPDVNVDTNGDGKPDINIDTNGDGKPDVDIDTNGDGKPDINIDTNGDGKPDINIDTNGDGKPDINIDTDGDGKPDINIDTDGDGIPDLNVDTDGDGKPDVNVDTNGDGKPDKNIKDPSEIKNILKENEPEKSDELPWWIPRTGDTANMLTWLAVLGAAVLGLCGTVYGIRKKKS